MEEPASDDGSIASQVGFKSQIPETESTLATKPSGHTGLKSRPTVTRKALETMLLNAGKRNNLLGRNISIEADPSGAPSKDTPFSTARVLKEDHQSISTSAEQQKEASTVSRETDQINGCDHSVTNLNGKRHSTEDHSEERNPKHSRIGQYVSQREGKSPRPNNRCQGRQTMAARMAWKRADTKIVSDQRILLKNDHGWIPSRRPPSMHLPTATWTQFNSASQIVETANNTPQASNDEDIEVFKSGSTARTRNSPTGIVHYVAGTPYKTGPSLKTLQASSTEGKADSPDTGTEIMGGDEWPTTSPSVPEQELPRDSSVEMSPVRLVEDTFDLEHSHDKIADALDSGDAISGPQETQIVDLDSASCDVETSISHPVVGDQAKSTAAHQCASIDSPRYSPGPEDSPISSESDFDPDNYAPTSPTPSMLGEKIDFIGEYVWDKNSKRYLLTSSSYDDDKIPIPHEAQVPSEDDDCLFFPDENRPTSEQGTDHPSVHHSLWIWDDDENFLKAVNELQSSSQRDYRLVLPDNMESVSAHEDNSQPKSSTHAPGSPENENEGQSHLLKESEYDSEYECLPREEQGHYTSEDEDNGRSGPYSPYFSKSEQWTHGEDVAQSYPFKDHNLFIHDPDRSPSPLDESSATQDYTSASRDAFLQLEYADEDVLEVAEPVRDLGPRMEDRGDNLGNSDPLSPVDEDSSPLRRQIESEFLCSSTVLETSPYPRESDSVDPSHAGNADAQIDASSSYQEASWAPTRGKRAADSISDIDRSTSTLSKRRKLARNEHTMSEWDGQLPDGVDMVAPNLPLFRSGSSQDGRSSRFPGESSPHEFSELAQHASELAQDVLDRAAVPGHAQPSGSFLEELHNRFRNRYPDYPGCPKHLLELCKMIQELMAAKENVFKPHPSQWDDFIVRHSLEYRRYVWHEVKNLAPYHQFYFEKIRTQQYMDTIVTPQALRAILDEESRKSASMTPRSPETSTRESLTRRLSSTSMKSSLRCNRPSSRSNSRLIHRTRSNETRRRLSLNNHVAPTELYSNSDGDASDIEVMDDMDATIPPKGARKLDRASLDSWPPSSSERSNRKYVRVPERTSPKFPRFLSSHVPQSPLPARRRTLPWVDNRRQAPSVAVPSRTPLDSKSTTPAAPKQGAKRKRTIGAGEGITESRRSKFVKMTGGVPLNDKDRLATPNGLGKSSKRTREYNPKT